MHGYYKYSIELFINNQWIEEIRYYQVIKDINDFDLISIKNKRRNAKCIY